MRSSIRRLLVCAVVAASTIALQSLSEGQSTGSAATGCSSPAAPRITAEPNPAVLVPLPGNVHPLARPQYDRGRVSDSLALDHMMLVLQRSPEQEKALAAQIEQMHTPGSATFHQWLRAEDVGRCYGVADSDIAKVSGWLQTQGFRIDTVPAGKMIIVFSGTAGQVRNAFKTEIHNLDVRGEQHLANMSNPQVPAALAPVIASVRSLNNFFPKPLVRNVRPLQRDPDTGKWRALEAGNSGREGRTQSEHSGIGPLITFNGGDSTYYAVGPQDFYTIYNETPLLTSPSPINGAGQTLAIVQDSDVNPADVTSFRAQFGLPTYPPTPNNTQGGINFIDGIPYFCSDPGLVPDGGETEADVDLQWIGTAAPAATIDFVACADTATTFGGDLSAIYIVSNLGGTVSAFSESFGECEAQIGSGEGFYYNLWQQAAAEGQTAVLAAGDDGDDTCDQGNGGGPNGGDIGLSGISVNGLASTPYNVAAGGTDFSDSYQTNFSPTNYWNNNDSPPYGSALSYVPEMAWNDSCASTILVDFLDINYRNGPEGLCNDTSNFEVPYPFTYLAGGGGGISALFSRPSWQSVYGVGLNGNYTSTSNRNLPDVSLFAGDGFWSHALLFCETDFGFGCDYSVGAIAFALSAGGTSFVAPQLAGILGLVNQATSSRQGQANYMFYSLAAQEYGTPSSPNTSYTAPSLYSCEGSNLNAIGNYGSLFRSCMFYDINRTSQLGFNSCLNGNNDGCLVNNNDQPCVVGTPNCHVNTRGDLYGLLSASNSIFEVAFPQSAGYSAATGLGSINVGNLALNWNTTPSDYTLTVSINSEGLGSVISGDGFINCPGVCTHAYPPNTLVTLSAIAPSGYFFGGWTGACQNAGYYCNVTLSAAQSVSALFFNLDSGYTLAVTVAGSGNVTSSPSGINCPYTCSAQFAQGTQVTLTSSPGSGSTFGGWIGPCSGTGSCNVTMNQNYSVTGDFTAPVEFVAVTPCRLVDTRSNNDPVRGGTFRDFEVPNLGSCNIPSSATAYSLNVTVVPFTPLNYLTIWPTGEDQPLVSTLNSPDARTKANAAIVPAGYQGGVSVFVTNTTHVILDIDGYFAPQGQSDFYPLTPCRVVDTRAGSMLTGGLGPPSFGNMETRALPILSSTCLNGVHNPEAYSFNATVVPQPSGQQLDYLTLWPYGQNMPLVSTLNNPTASVVANGALVAAGTQGKIDAFTYNSTDLIIDINGYFAAPGENGYALYPVAPCRVFDSRDNNGQPINGTVTINVAGSPCTPPANAAGFVFNATVVPPGSLGYLTLWPTGEPMPIVSTLNAYDGFITSNLAIVPNNTGSINAFVSNPTHLILDISGYFAPQPADSPKQQEATR